MRARSPRAALPVAMDERVRQRQDFSVFVLRHAIVNITARAFDENHLVANHAGGVIQFIRERRFLVKEIRYFAEMFFAQTGLHLNSILERLAGSRAARTGYAHETKKALGHSSVARMSKGIRAQLRRSRNAAKL